MSLEAGLVNKACLISSTVKDVGLRHLAPVTELCSASWTLIPRKTLEPQARGTLASFVLVMLFRHSDRNSVMHTSARLYFPAVGRVEKATWEGNYHLAKYGKSEVSTVALGRVTAPRCDVGSRF